MAEVKYPSNSFKDMNQQSTSVTQTKKNLPESKKPKKVAPVIKGNVKKNKKSEFTKIKEMFFAQDVGSIKNYVIMDVIVPAVKKAICDTIKDSADMLFYGKTMPRKRSNNGIVNFRDYAGVSRRSSDLPVRRSSRSSVYEYDGIEFESRSDAEDVLDALSEILEQYDDVTVADFYQLAGQTPNSSDSDFGWDNIATARVERLENGNYTLVMPRLKRI